MYITCRSLIDEIEIYRNHIEQKVRNEMSDIELLIKIPEEVYKRAKETHDVMCDSVWLGIKYGTPIPKGHGRLIDADAISLDDIGFFSISDYQKMVHKLTTSCQTIIEADEEK